VKTGDPRWTRGIPHQRRLLILLAGALQVATRYV
jgi:hypothetical protein